MSDKFKIRTALQIKRGYDLNDLVLDNQSLKIRQQEIKANQKNTPQKELSDLALRSESIIDNDMTQSAENLEAIGGGQRDMSRYYLDGVPQISISPHDVRPPKSKK